MRAAAGRWVSHVEAEIEHVTDLPTEMQPGPKLFFLASYKHGFCNGCVMWWRPNECGYTPDIKQAGTYTAEQVAALENDETVAVPVEWLHQNARIRMTVDVADTHSVPRAFWNPGTLRAAIASK